MIGFTSALVCIIVSVCVQAVKYFFCPKLLNIRRERYICRRLCFTTGKNSVNNTEYTETPRLTRKTGPGKNRVR